MLDFTSALYLGLRHPSPSLRPWPALTTGKPAALQSSRVSAAIAGEFAALVGCERATPLASTLHLFWDLFGLLARDRVRIYMDEGSYAIARWGVERAAARGVPVREFPHRDATALSDLIKQDRRSKRRPVVVADGFCPSCGNAAPLPEFLQCVAPQQGYVVIDDTQALGVLGEQGGGSLRWQSVRSPDVIVGSSLAKGFGAPMAMLAGSAGLIRRFEAESDTRVHCSPPSIATLRAAEQALDVNRSHGERLRRYLALLVCRFQAGLRAIGLVADGGPFPVQTLQPAGIAAEVLRARLLRRGIRTVVVRRCREIATRVAFLITALHRHSDIDMALEAIAQAMTSDHSTHQLTGRVS
ncbi:aminotransferase class I/II-fold pyridoxal phosphate-dependent enzyme [Bradyrhizobium sp. JYMT SZCCT0428]|uniref:aminotransferase class I/II-fold pyridoxal phosphate-dependent enzyme n=1 Tax=Bradyrhizobium sp. JYMT SZCCT0428 TaxID=2807673 RepID=UPI001BA95C57|nr:aminotransferase class I/II-fold pyridoxal phosphate-dependent enzyme [Bradyrhizobium sp. JYMT SZCCT0428]MBR1149667.1 pyridoxal phosphate-dependent aminotransferase family protein [Bradyrhizobium sp. JYMT SZCCT0428]